VKNDGHVTGFTAWFTLQSHCFVLTHTCLKQLCVFNVHHLLLFSTKRHSWSEASTSRLSRDSHGWPPKVKRRLHDICGTAAPSAESSGSLLWYDHGRRRMDGCIASCFNKHVTDCMVWQDYNIWSKIQIYKHILQQFTAYVHCVQKKSHWCLLA